MDQQMMANYLRAMGGNAPDGIQQAIQQLMQMNMAQGQGPQMAAQAQGLAGLQQPPMQMGGFMNPQMPSSGMGSAQANLMPQQGVIRR